MATDLEKAPLIAPPSGAVKEPRQFKGPWYCLFGDCGGNDVAACCLATNAPHVAFGWNGARAHGLSWWKEALKLILLTCGSFVLVRVIFTVMLLNNCSTLDAARNDGAYNNMAVTHYNNEMPVYDTVVNTDGSWSIADATSTSVDANSGNGGPMIYGEDTGFNAHRPENHDLEQLLVNMNPEDVQACILQTFLTPWAALLVAFAVACIVYASYFAAMRRKNMREKFGIESTFCSDWLLWLMCAPCAVTQETRTLMHNHVEEGLWHGPLQAPAQSAAMST